MSIPWKRVIRWTLYLSCLMLLGVGIYRFEPHEPRWTVAGGNTVIDTPIRFAADGARVYASPFPPARPTFGFTTYVYLWDFEGVRVPPPPRKLRAFDLPTGTPCSEHPAMGRLTATNEFSKDGRYFAAVCEWPEAKADGERFVCLVDLQTDEEIRLPLPCSLDEAPLHFSPSGQYLIVGLTEQEGPVQVYECATGQLLEERFCWGLLWNAVCAEGHLLFLDQDAAERRRIMLWNLRERKVAATLTTIKDNASVRLLGHLLVVQGDQEGQWFTWNMRTRKLECEWKTELRGGSLSEVVPIGEHACASILGSANADLLEFWDIQTGKRIGAGKHPGWTTAQFHDPTGRYWALYSPQQRSFYNWSSRREPPTGFQLLELPSLKKLWELDATQQYAVAFHQDGKRIIVAPSTGAAVHIRNCETGEVQQTIAVGQIRPAFNALILVVSKDGKHLLIQQPDATNWPAAGNTPIWRRVLQWLRIDPDDPAKARDFTILYDLETNCERLRLRGCKIDDALLSDDGATLITTHTEQGGTRVLRCWDVGSTKPWRWPLAIPATLGVLLWGAAKGVARWRKRRAAKSGFPSKS